MALLAVCITRDRGRTHVANVCNCILALVVIPLYFTHRLRRARLLVHVNEATPRCASCSVVCRFLFVSPLCVASTVTLEGLRCGCGLSLFGYVWPAQCCRFMSFDSPGAQS